MEYGKTDKVRDCPRTESLENAARLLAAIEHAQVRTFKPRTVDNLHQEFGLGEEA
jgi:hypothetical protein